MRSGARRVSAIGTCPRRSGISAEKKQQNTRNTLTQADSDSMVHHKTIIKTLERDRDLLILTIFIILTCIIGSWWNDYRIISPCPPQGCHVQTVMAFEDESELEEITSYIIRTFEKYGRQTAVKAVACFISESGLRVSAYGYNKRNDTGDYGLAQINSIHRSRYGDKFMYDWKTNIDVAEKIFLSANKTFKPWYGKYCQ